MLINIFWILALVCACIGGIFILAAFGESGAPQQAASAAIGIGIAIIPYCVARAVTELDGKNSPTKQRQSQIQLLAALANKDHEPPTGSGGDAAAPKDFSKRWES